MEDQVWVSDAVRLWTDKALNNISKNKTAGIAPAGSWHSGHLIAESKKDSKRPAGVSHKDYVKIVLKGLREDERLRSDGPLFWAGVQNTTSAQFAPASSEPWTEKAGSLKREIGSNIALASILKVTSDECLRYLEMKHRGSAWPSTKAELKQGIVAFLKSLSSTLPWIQGALAAPLQRCGPTASCAAASSCGIPSCGLHASSAAKGRVIRR